ncbi:MAG: phosphate ABC transporter permease subunit PstC [Spirochaetaceae bacterium]
MRFRPYYEQGVRGVFALCAALSVLSVLFITLFIMIEGLPLFFVSLDGHTPPTLAEFLFGTDWYPIGSPPSFGIAPFIVASLMVTAGALVLAVPIGIAVGIFIAEIAKGRIQSVLRSATEILAGIPSVVYGFFGVMIIGFFLDRVANPLVNYNAFSGMAILAVMTLPTIINITEVSIRAVPRDYADGSFALGSTHWQTIWRVILPASRSGILTGVILGMGRAVGETMAVLMVAGNQPTLPMDGLRSRVRTLTMAIVNDMGYAGGDHRVSLFTTAVVLFIFILLLNLTTQIINRRSELKVRPDGTTNS